MGEQSLEDLLRQATVRVMGPRPGAGFFVAPGIVLTCVHVVGRNAPVSVAGNPVRSIERLCDRGRPIPILDEDYPDVAIVRLDRTGHPCVALDDALPIWGDSFQTYGFPDEGGSAELLTPVGLEYRGIKGPDATRFLDLKADTVKPGMSGGPLLNMRTRAVCGVVVATRNSASADGGLAVPWAVLAERMPEVVEANRRFHEVDRRWSTAVVRARHSVRFRPPRVVGDSVWDVPARNRNFVGREDQLEKLHMTLGARRGEVAFLAVSGLGGVGKTQLAIEYAWRRAAEHELVWWVPAEVPATIPASFARLAERLGLPIEAPSAMTGLLHAELGRQGRWLLIFDNADGPDSLAPYLPPAGGGAVLVTSRNPAWRSRGVTLGLDVLAKEEAATFLLSRTGSEDKGSAEVVAEDLGLLPLALEQAAAYVEETGMSLDTYAALLKSRRGEMLGRGTPAFYEQTVAATFGLAYDQAAAQSPSVVQLLGACAVLAPDDIPTELVVTGDTLAAEDTLSLLRRLALIRREGDAIAVHGVVGTVVRQRLGRESVASRAAAGVAALYRAFPRPAADHRSWPRSARLLPHVLAVAAYADPTVDLARLLTSAGAYLGSREQLRSASEVLEKALEIFEAAYGPDHPEAARALGNLGLVLQALGDLTGARESQERALSIQEAAYGPEGAEVAIALNNLGMVLRDLGDLVGARRCQERALQIKEAAYGPDDGEIALTLNNLGNVLHDLGDLAGARACYERALQINKTAYGPDHGQVGVTLTNLGVVRGALGDRVGAREALERALGIVQEAYGPNHPNTASAQRNLHDLRDV